VHSCLCYSFYFYFKHATIRFDYSLKNIPIPSQDAYLKPLIEKVESVTKRMRWKANFFLKGSTTQNQSNLFDLSSNKSPPSIPLLKPFEDDDDLIKLIENVKFWRSKDQFQTSLANNLKKINSSPNIFIFADKTRK
jgi:hypothetical protein